MSGLRVLLVGGGGREHALAWKLAQSPRLGALYAAPGNPGIARVAECVPVRADDVAAIVALADRERIDLTVVGPEGAARARAWPTRSRRAAARSSGHPAPRRRWRAPRSSPRSSSPATGSRRRASARSTTPARPGPSSTELGGRAVVKADGLAAGKGAVVCRDPAEAARAIGDMLERRVFGDAGARVVVEELLEGEEVSVFALTDGRTVCPLASAQDHKAVFDGDRGPNTGGMGAYSPAPVLDPALARRGHAGPCSSRRSGRWRPRGAPIEACSSPGLMLTAAGVRVLEYNVRFGDPECQVLMLRLVDDLLPLCQAVAEGRGLPPSVAWRPEAAVCVVLASGGYPGEYATGRPDRGHRAGRGAPGRHGLSRRHRAARGAARHRGRAGPRRRRARRRHPRRGGGRLRRGRGDPLRRRALSARHRSPRPRSGPAPTAGSPAAPMSRAARLVVDASRPAPEALAAAAASLQAGGLVAFPTETFYGLGAHALDEAAVAPRLPGEGPAGRQAAPRAGRLPRDGGARRPRGVRPGAPAHGAVLARAADAGPAGAADRSRRP